MTGVPGGGKSSAMRDDLLSTSALYVLALPRTELIDEVVADLNKTADERGVNLIIEPIHSRQDREGRNVRRRVHDALVRREPDQHRVVLVTHETLLTLDPAHLDGVDVRMDETPDGAILSGEFHGKMGSHVLEHHFILEPLDDGSPRSMLRMRPGVEPITPAAYTGGATEITAVLKAASNRNRTVAVDLRSWDEARITGRRVRWWSIWTPMALKGAATVGLAASGFRDSLLARACTKLHGDDLAIEFVDVAHGARRANPKIRVHYFTPHRGSTAWWQSDQGSRCLVAISRHLEGIGFDGYWSCNEAIRPYFIHRFGGDACAPRLAGTNSLRHHRAVAYIYSNKAQKADDAILEFLDLDKEAITRVREDEDIAQIVMRGAIRDPSYDGDYDIYLYDRHQAEELRDYLIEHRVSDRVRVVPVVEAGIMNVRRPRSSKTAGDDGCRASPLSLEARRRRDLTAGRLRQQRRRDAAREQRRAAGHPIRKPGRPRKDAIPSVPTPRA